MRISLLILAVLVAFGSCSPYQKVLKSEDVGLKFHHADSLYNAGKYRKALKLMEQIVPAYRGKPQAEKLMYIYSDTYYQLGDYHLAGYQFERFTVTYPASEKVEEAAFKGAKSYYNLSPRFSLDQKETNMALEKLQGFIDKYPDSDLLGEANQLVSELTTKLERKRFEIAKQYHHVYDYREAITAFDIFLLDYPGSQFRMEAYYLRFESAYLLAINSVASLVEERLIAAKGHYTTFNRYYSESERKADADELMVDIDKRLKNKQV